MDIFEKKYRPKYRIFEVDTNTDTQKKSDTDTDTLAHH